MHTGSGVGDLINPCVPSSSLVVPRSGVGDLILVYKRVTHLASHTGRVAGLLERVRALSAEDREHKELFRRNVSATHFLGVAAAACAGACVWEGGRVGRRGRLRRCVGVVDCVRVQGLRGLAGTREV